MAKLLAALLLALAAVPAAAQDIGGLSWLAGSWRGAGTMSGRASEASLEAKPVLGARFLELRYRAGDFEGLALYQPAADGRWQGRWFDNRGISFAIEASLAGRVLTSDWGAAGGERGRTVYRLLDDGRLEATDSVMATDGGWRTFARHLLIPSR